MKIESENQSPKVALQDVSYGESFLYEGVHYMRLDTIELATLATSEVLRNVVAVNILTGQYLCLSEGHSPEVVPTNGVVVFREQTSDIHEGGLN